ncbi:ABC transporter substrate-binding protein [Nocardiopsis composta]
MESVLAPDRSVVNTFVVNTSDPVLSDTAVRQAIQHGIDRAELAGTFYGEGVEPATDIVSQAHPYYTDRSDLLDHDPDRSRSLLEKAGWKEGGDGIRTKDGEPLEVELAYVAGTIGADAAGWEYVQSRLADIGIRLELTPVSDAEQADLHSSDDWQLAVYQGASRGDADGIAAFYSTDLTVWGAQAPVPRSTGSSPSRRRPSTPRSAGSWWTRPRRPSSRRPTAFRCTTPARSCSPAARSRT